MAIVIQSGHQGNVTEVMSDLTATNKTSFLCIGTHVSDAYTSNMLKGRKS